METVLLVIIVSFATLVAIGRLWGFVQRLRRGPGCPSAGCACSDGGGCACSGSDGPGGAR